MKVLLGYSKCNNNNLIMIIMIIMWHSAQNKPPFKKKKMLTKLKLFCQKLAFHLDFHTIIKGEPHLYLNKGHPVLPADWYHLISIELANRGLLFWWRSSVFACRGRGSFCGGINLDMQLLQWRLIHSTAAPRSRRTNGSLPPSCRGLNELNCLSGFSSAA